MGDGHPYAGPGRQFHAPKGQALIDTQQNLPRTATWRVPMPDSRVRCKVSVLFSPTPGTTNAALPIDVTLAAAKIWGCLAEEDFAGRIAGPVPTQNVVVDPTTGLLVTRAAPLSIPSDAGVMGWSREFVTAGDNLYFELTATLIPGTPGRWMLYTRYQPDGLYLPQDEWDQIRALCDPFIVTRILGAGGNV
jgi:hypothetical protein